MEESIRLGKSGRLVLPKKIRDALGLREGSSLRITTGRGRIELELQTETARVEMAEDGFPVIRGGPPIGKNAVLEAILEGRDERDARAAATRVRPR